MQANYGYWGDLWRRIIPSTLYFVAALRMCALICAYGKWLIPEN